MRKECKEFFNGNPVARSYDVEKCIKQNENLEIQHNGEIMTLTPTELKTKLVATSKSFSSKFGGTSYRLLGYTWNPDKAEL